MSAERNNRFLWARRLLRRPDHQTPATGKPSLLARLLGLIALRAAAEWVRDLLRDMW